MRKMKVRNLIFIILMLMISSISACSFKIGNASGQADSQTAEAEKKYNQSGESNTFGKELSENIQSGLTGTYRYKNGSYNNAIGIEELGGNRLRIGIAVNYEYKSDGEWMANSGSANEIATLKGNTAVLVPRDFSACQITLKFDGGKITVRQLGTESDCGFGAQTNADGVYTKTSNELDYNEMIDEMPGNSTDNYPVQNNKRIRFERGKSSTVISGKIARGEEQTFLVGARAGQMMDIKIIEGGVNNDVVFSLIAPDGTNLISDNGYDSVWRGKLPKTGDYKIAVGVIESENVDFKISVAIR